MQTLIIARHGLVNREDESLSPLGKLTVHNLADRIKIVVDGRSVAIFSSLAQRAIETALMIDDVFGVGVQRNPSLGDEDGRSSMNDVVSQFVDIHARDADVLVLVTHATTANTFPEYYVTRLLRRFVIVTERLDEGQALSIDTQTGEVRMI